MIPAPLIIGGGLLVGGLLLRRFKRRELVNPEPFDGQLFTVSKRFDGEVNELSQETGIPFNTLMFGMYEESGLRADAHVNKIDRPKPEKDKYIFGLYDDNLEKRSKETGFPVSDLVIGPKTWGGGLFGLVRPYHKPYTEGLPFELWLMSDRYTQLQGFRLFVLGAKGKIKSPQDMRMYGFASAHVGAAPEKVIYKDPTAAYTVHSYLDLDGDGTIEAWELYDGWNKKYNKHVAFAKAHGPRQIKGP